MRLHLPSSLLRYVLAGLFICTLSLIHISGRKSLDDEHLLEQLYREVNFCLTVENGIK